MQLFAFDQQRKPIAAERALHGRNYFCAECGAHVRVRGGMHVRKHFFHQRSGLQCRSAAKSLSHIQTQFFIQRSIGHDQVQLERFFPEIRRIADVCWENEKIIFEVQCSAISAPEVLARNKDYASLGYQVIWVPHDSTFNGGRLSEAEQVMRRGPHYFTNINPHGEGGLYDQLDLVVEGRRVYKSPLWIPRLREYQSTERPLLAPEPLHRRWIHGRGFFSGDCLGAWQEGDPQMRAALVQASSARLSRLQIGGVVKKMLAWLLRQALEGASASPRR
ncbi:MAG: hypothetical protein KDK78_03010 [Chlamydiia bacterium]|nr:hypothetical protein [Chlamydiia bacterium]